MAWASAPCTRCFSCPSWYSTTSGTAWTSQCNAASGTDSASTRAKHTLGSHAWRSWSKTSSTRPHGAHQSAQKWTTKRRRSTCKPRSTSHVDAETPQRGCASGAIVWSAAERLRDPFWNVDVQVAAHVRRVQRAFARQRVGPEHLQGSTGYGHGDQSREALDGVLAYVLGTECAAARAQFVSGTHAIAAALYGTLRCDDVLISATGPPYDTLRSVIGGPAQTPVVEGRTEEKKASVQEGSRVEGTDGQGADDLGTLHDWGVRYEAVPLREDDGAVDLDKVKEAVRRHGDKARLVLVQRSCGYDTRPTLRIGDVEQVVQAVRTTNPGCAVLVDNCYGEFTDALEPGHVGADLVAGSFIKNIGATIAPGGGYVAGRKDLVLRACARLSAPGVGMEAGAVPSEYARLMLQGIWLSPGIVGEACKGAMLVAEVMRGMGYVVHHRPGDAVVSVVLGRPDLMLRFAEAVQRCCPVGAHVVPVAGATPGYPCDVLFAEGAFVDGSTSELSADGPLRPPFAIYCQGGTHWTQWAYALEAVLDAWPVS
mmetsp:Transcript_519/g.1872  ORF Transcript_519/g.1872 Transcript_519/m.1872 type:complete len:539 (-) Transcript_519:205-1821(-)